MDMKEAMLAIMREYLLPELEGLKSGQIGLRSDIANVNKRLDDVNLHLVDQSRRIDTLREELGQRIDTVREELGQRIETLREELGQRIDAVREELSGNIAAVREELNNRMDETNKRLDRLYEVIVRRDEHSAIVIKINELDHEVREIKQRLAA